MLVLDGSIGEGGGQILRTALALSLCTQQSFHIDGIRAARKKPGLQPQHLAAVHAAAAIADAEVQGATKGSDAISFKPNKVQSGDYHFNIGTAGSTMLVLQTLLPALSLTDKPSTLTLKGGTHNPFAPPYTFIDNAFLPLFNSTGATIKATLLRPGFAPRGGGEVNISIEPVNNFQPLILTERGDIERQYAEVIIANLPEHIARRELAVIHKHLCYSENQLSITFRNDAIGPGNIVSVMIKSEHVSECLSAFGQRGIPAEQVAQDVVRQVQHYINADVPVGPYLADQLLLPIALAGSGEFVTMKPSLHTATNLIVIEKFLDIALTMIEIGPDQWKIALAQQ